MSHSSELPHIVVIGAGFAGLEVIKGLKDQPVQITLIDRNNYHQFTPLLYQVATAQLECEEIVFPIRQIIDNQENVRFLMADVIGLDQHNQKIMTSAGEVGYEFLVIATGSVTSYFGIEDAHRYTYPLKTLSHGMELRNHVLRLMEEAEHLSVAEREALLTFVIVGGGPTGVEFAGALAELVNGPLLKDHPTISREEITIHLIDGGPRLLSDFVPKLSNYTINRLEKLGVSYHPSVYVTDVSSRFGYLSTGEEIATKTIVWSTGISGPDYLAEWNLPVTSKNFVRVDEYLKVEGHPQIYAIGDVSQIEETFLPKNAMVAQQQGSYVAESIAAELNHEPAEIFVFKDKGKMAVIGRNAAVVQLKRLKISGFFAWFLWSGLHIFKLIGMRNRLNIMINWIIAYFRKGGQARVILPLPNKTSEKELLRPVQKA